MKRLWPIGVLVALVLGAWWAVGAVSQNDGAVWSEVRRDDLVLGVEVNGELAATETSQLGPPQLSDYWDFKISFMAPEGDEVEAGAPVLGFDTENLEQQLLTQQAEAEQARKNIERTEKNLAMQRRQDLLRLAEAEARQRKAELIVQRPEALSKADELAVAQLDLELARKELAYLQERVEGSRRSAESQLATLRGQQQRAEQRVVEIRQAIEMMTRRAPRAGTVIYVTDWNDEKKKVGDTCWKGQNVVELPDLRTMKADGRVDEADAGKLAERQRVTLRLDAHPDVEFAGRIASIWKTVRHERGSQVKMARLEIELDETDTRKMRPGMRFRGRVETERISEAVLLPIDAVFLQAEGPVVYRKTLFGFDTVSVELGRRNDSHVEVLSGLQPGDSVSLVDPTHAGRT